jgi:hypothetical protein
MSNNTCKCPCCRADIEAPHEYHLERRPMAKLLPCGCCGTKPGPNDHCFCANCGAVLVTQDDVDARNAGVETSDGAQQP